MGGYHQTDFGSSWRQGNGLAIVEGSRHPAFRMGAHVIRGLRKRLFDHLQIQETVVTAREAITPRLAANTSKSGAASRIVTV